MLTEHHRREPLSLGLSREEVRDRVFGQVRPEIFRAVISRLGQEGKVIAERDGLRSASHRPALTDADESTKRALETALKAAGLQAGTLEETAAATGQKSSLPASCTTCWLPSAAWFASETSFFMSSLSTISRRGYEQEKR